MRTEVYVQVQFKGMLMYGYSIAFVLKPGCIRKDLYIFFVFQNAGVEHYP